MLSRSLSAAPRRVIGLFLALTVLPSALLVGVGWQLFRQDKANALQQLQVRRAQAADLAVTALEQRLTNAERALENPTAREALTAAGDAAIVTIDRNSLAVSPGTRLAYSPSPMPGRDASPALFLAAERLEYAGDLAEAGAEYRHLALSSDPAVRAAALTRWARTVPDTMRLPIYAQLENVRRAAIEGVPADLLARLARCQVLNALGRRQEHLASAVALRDELRNGRWSISKVVYEANLAEAGTWANDAGPISLTNPERLAAIVDELWQERERAASRDASSTRRRIVTIGGVTGTVLWSTNGKAPVALVALPSFVDREWLAPVQSMVNVQRVQVHVQDPATRGSSAVSDTRRLVTDTGLPWTLVVADTDPAAELAHVESRRSLWLAGLATLVVLLGAGACLVTRAVARELAVAQLQSDFVAAVSHEFRTPLTSMRQLTEILVDERVAAEERRRAYYQALARQTERLHRLVESLLDFGRIEAGTSPYRLEPLDACALVRTVVESFEQDPASHGTNVQLDLEGQSLPVSADRDALTNALWNLLDNAVKYSPACRTVWVRVERHDDRILIRVRDQGLGIPASEQRTIFDKFVRGALAKAEGIKGTGIGLSMVRHIARAHGGDVQVDSAPGAGSTFTILLPVRT